MTINLRKITQGERGTLTFTWEFPDNLTSPASISGAVITATMTDEDGVTTAVSGTLTGTTATTCTWALSAGDSGTAGTFTLLFKAVVSGVTTYTLEATLEVIANPAATAAQNDMLVGVSEDEAAWVTAGLAAVADGADLVETSDLTAVSDALTAHIDDTTGAHDDSAIAAAASAVNYTPAAATVEGHLSGIDTALASAGGGGQTLYTAVVDAGGDGDYTTISAALAAASARDAIFIRNGTYDGGVTVSLDNIRIVGESRDGAVIQSPLSSTACITVTGDDVVIENVTVDGRRASQSGTGGLQGFSGVYIDGAQRLKLRNSVVKNTLGNGITANGSTTDSDDGAIEYCTIQNTATDGSTPTTGAHLPGIQLINGTARWRIIGNFVTGWSQGIGLWYGARDCIVANNVLYANYGYADTGHITTRSAAEDYGADVTTHGSNVWVANMINGATSECIECAQGVIGSKFIGNVLRNANKFGDDTGFGAKIIGTAGEPTRDILFYGNTLYGDSTGTNRSGLTINTQGGVTVSDNNIFDCVNTGSTGPIQVQGTTAQATITGNKISNCAGGIYTVNAAAFIRAFGNSISSPASTNILINILAGAGYVISENKLDANGVNCTGIQIAATAGDNHRISGNVCTGFMSTCIDIRSDYNIVRDNRMITTNVFGALTIAAGHYNIVTGNYCDAGGVGRTIYLQSSPTYNVIQDNILVGVNSAIFESGESGVWMTTATNKITPNHKTTITVPTQGLPLGAQTVGASPATIAHGLPWIPREIRIQMTSAGTIWKSAVSDATNIYLTADDADRTAEVFVR